MPDLLGIPSVRGHVPLVIALCINAIGAGLAGPLILLYLTGSGVGLSVSTAGIILTVSGGVSLLVPALSAMLAARFGARGIVTAGQWLQALGAAGLLLAVLPLGRVIPLVATCCLMLSVGQRAFWSSVFALVADAASDDISNLSGGQNNRDARTKKDAWFAMAGMTQGVGFTIGALLAGGLLTVPGDLPYLVALGLSAVSFATSAMLLTRTRKPTPPAPVDQAKVVLRPDWPYILWIATNTLFAFCSIVLGVGLPLYVVQGLEAPAWMIGPLLALNTVLGATCQGLAVRVAARFSRTRMLMLAGALWAAWGIAMATLDIAPVWIVLPGLVASVLTYSIAELIHAPLSMGLASDAAPEASRPRYLAWFQYSFAIASVLAPGIFALTFALAASLPWLLTSGISLLACLGAAVSARHLSRRVGAIEGE